MLHNINFICNIFMHCLKDMKDITKRFLMLALALALVLGGMQTVCVPAVAAETDDAASSDWPDYPDVEAECAILIEASTGTILYQKSAHQKMYPASITKILTAILTIENAELDETVTFSETAVNLESDASNIECVAGEEMSVEDCLYALMLASANEAANALAEHVAGSNDAFAELMNEYAEAAGATDSNFVNPSGLHDDNHYITAYDMAMITRAAIENPIFCAITGTCEYIIEPTNKTDTERELNHRHKMVWSAEYSSVAYDGVIGGKTGYTSEAGTTLVTYAERDGMTLVCVVLNSSGYNAYYDTATLFDYGFDNFEIAEIADEETLFARDETGIFALSSVFSSSIPSLGIEEDCYAVFPSSVSFSDLERVVSFDGLSSGQSALLSYYCGNTLVGTAAVLTNYDGDDESADDSSGGSASDGDSGSSSSDGDSDSSSSDETSGSLSSSGDDGSGGDEAEIAASDGTGIFASIRSADSKTIKRIVIALCAAVALIIIILIIRNRLRYLDNLRRQKRTRYR